jgi:hypothetical protein
METATARMIEKNAFMVLRYSLVPARVRLPDRRRNCAADFVAVCVRNEDRSPRENPRLETQPQLQPALLRLSAMISQYFNLPGCFPDY